ncbi:PREDICTED: uncharacterized protein LOC105368449 [Ceratosolen solmsi marchali]|uniref:Uncharacterized protein LOC105368449 n=1 Tax=Ceratosolen solmsi marchali TaxID=326594 RepID=A0AAJ6YWR2_9HYME|nr:PREDICTED: uncharacterized protein LOC105368449 [Ceratosolen solmsi marchali]
MNIKVENRHFSLNVTQVNSRRDSPNIPTVVVGNVECGLIKNPLRKENIKARNKEDLAQEAARVLQQVDSVDCFAHNYNHKYSSLPTRRRKSKQSFDINANLSDRPNEKASVTIADELASTPKAKKKALEWNANDAGSYKIKQTISKLFSPKLERKQRPLTSAKLLRRSYSDVGSHIHNTSKSHRKRSGSDSEGLLLNIVRSKKPLSPIIESSPQIFDQSFHFDNIHEAKKSKQEEKKIDSERKIECTDDNSVPNSVVSTRIKIIPIHIENVGTHVSKRGLSSLNKKTVDIDKVDHINKSMLHSSRYDQIGKESTIHKMINRLSNDCSPPPQLTRTMITPGPGFGHNNNRPFSYTRPNESNMPSLQTDVIYAQVQLDKKKAQRSHSDSDEGLGLDRKDSSRENSPAEKEYHRTDLYTDELQHNNEFNSFKSLYDDERTKTKQFGNFGNSTNNFIARNAERRRFHNFDDMEKNLLSKPEKYTSSIFVDTLNYAKANSSNSRHIENNELKSRLTKDQSKCSKASGLSARRDLLESRIKSRLLADEIFAAKSNLNLPKTIEHEIIDKPIVPSPVIPNRVESPKRCIDTYISETRTNSNGEKYMFKKEIHEDNGKVYGYEKKITNKIPVDKYLNPQSKDGYTVETHTDQFGDKYIIEMRTHSNCSENFSPVFNTQGTKSPEMQTFLSTRLLNEADKTSTHTIDEQLIRESRENEILLPSIITRDSDDYSFSQNEDNFIVYRPKIKKDANQTKIKKTTEIMKGKSKSTQRLDELDNITPRLLEKKHITRSYENLTSTDYINALDNSTSSGYKGRLSFVKCHPDDLQGLNDEYDTDISQVTNNQLESSKYYTEIRTTNKHLSNKLDFQDDYDSSPSCMHVDRNNYSSSRADITARDSIICETSMYSNESHNIRKDNQKIIEENSRKPIRVSENRLDYLDNSNAREGSRSKLTKEGSEIFNEIPQRPPRVNHENKFRHPHHEMRGYTERRHRETMTCDTDRKDRLADSGIENDYRRDSQEADRREPFESEDEGFVTMEFIKQERRHTDCNMNLNVIDKGRYDKYVMYYESKNIQPVTSKPPSGADAKKYEKKSIKKSGTMSKVKELFRKKEKKANEEKNKKNAMTSNSGTLTDDEVLMRYKEYRGDQLRSAKSTKDLKTDINEDEYRQRRRLSTPSGSPSPPQHSRLSRSTGTLIQPIQQLRYLKSTPMQDNQVQEAERKGWFKSLSRKNKSSAKHVDKEPRIPESEILTTATENEEASSVPERISVQKNLRFFGDTDQESISSNRIDRNKQVDDRTKTSREITNTSRHPMGIIVPQRKPSRFTESALSSGESTTGDSSQQSQNSQRSQRSVVYLHAATVGEIPGPNERRRAASREELNRPLTAHTRTVSRSVSVLAPWRPKNYREPYEINYDQQQLAKPVTTIRRRHRSRETLSRRGKEPRRSKDSKTGTTNRSTLKSKDKQKVDRTVSTESLASKSRNVNSRQELHRSTSVPRDPNKSAGWFKMKNKKSQA